MLLEGKDRKKRPSAPFVYLVVQPDIREAAPQNPGREFGPQGARCVGQPKTVSAMTSLVSASAKVGHRLRVHANLESRLQCAPTRVASGAARAPSPLPLSSEAPLTQCRIDSAACCFRALVPRVGKNVRCREGGMRTVASLGEERWTYSLSGRGPR